MSATNGHAVGCAEGDGIDVALDRGAARETRLHLCTKRAWCSELAGHGGPCLIIPGAKQEPPDFGPKR